MGRAQQALLDRARRLDARHAALALDGGGQRAALAADECARAAVDVQMEGEVRAQNVVPEQAELLIAWRWPMRRRSTASGYSART